MFSRKKSDKKVKSSSSHRSHRSRKHHGRHQSNKSEDLVKERTDGPNEDEGEDEDEDENEDVDEDEVDTKEYLTSGPQNPNLPLSYAFGPLSLSAAQTYNPSSSSAAQTSNSSSSRQPDYYYDIGIPPTLGSLKLTKFRVVSHSTGPIPGQEPHSASHWSIYLIHDNGSIRLSMDIDKLPEIPYPRGRISIFKYNYTSATNSAVRFWEFPIIKDVTVKEVYHTIGSHRRHLYDMGDNGRGCRFWVQHVMIDMEVEGYITGYTRDVDYIEEVKIEDIIEYRYSKGVGRVPFPMIEGIFL